MAKNDQNEKSADTETASPLVGIPQHLLTQLVEALAARQQTDASPELIRAIDAMSAQVAATRELGEQVKRTVRHSNAQHENVSAFNYDPRCKLCTSGARHDDGQLGHPKPALKYHTYFCGGVQRAEDLTPIEIELYNSFEKNMTARDGAWTAIIDRDGSKRRLSVYVPFNGMDTRGDLPPLTQILTELLYGQTVADPVLALAHIQELQRQVAQLMAERNQAAPVGA